MPNLKSPTKELRKTKRKTTHNVRIKSELKTIERKFLQLLKDNKADEATAALKVLNSKLDKAASKKVIRKEKASRKTALGYKRLRRISASSK